MYLYHILFTPINICGIDCQKKREGRKGDTVVEDYICYDRTYTK
jgi:hypothetical protein